MVVEYLAGLHTGAQLVKDALAIYREWKAARGGGNAPEELGQKLEQAAQHLELAKAAEAQKLGFPLCRCDYPPKIMLFVGHDEHATDLADTRVYRCSSCGNEEPPQHRRRRSGNEFATVRL